MVILSDPIKQDVKNTFNVCPGTTVAQWLVESGYDAEIIKQPTLLLLNSEPLLEKDFDTRMNAGDILTLVPQPAFDPVTALFWIGFAISMASTAYSIYLALTLDTGLDDTDDRTQNTKISYRGNHARQGSSRPICYGTFRSFPDLAAQPYSNFDAAGDQELYMLLEVSEGECDCSDHEFDGTPLTNWSSDDYDVEVLQPGAPSTIFPDSVYVNSAVDNITLQHDPAAATPYVVCAINEEVEHVEIDISLPEGIYIVNSVGRWKYHSVDLHVQWRLAGSADEWESLFKRITYAWEPWNFTITIPFNGRDHAHGTWSPPGRYEMRCYRFPADVNDSKTMEKVVLSGLRGFVPATQDASSSTRIALRARSSDSLGSQALTKFSTLVKRKLPIWDGATWSAPTLTNSGIWAFVDILKSSGKRTDAYIDLPALKAIDDVYTTVEFNGVFDSATTVKDACDEVAAGYLGRAYERPGNVYSMILDTQDTPTRMFTSRSIVDGSFELTHIFPGTTTSDAVTVSYFDQHQGYRETSVTCSVPGSSELNPKKMKLRGVTNVWAALVIAYRMAAENEFRRDTIKFSTGTEGVLCNFGDTIRVQHYELGRLSSNNAVSGDIVAYNSGTITVLEDISAHTSGTPYCFLLNRDASPQGPYLCSVSGQDITIIDAFQPEELTFDDDLVRPTFAIGAADDFMISMKITAISDTGNRTYGISGFIDNSNVYVPPDEIEPTTLPVRQDLNPVISNLQYELFGESDNPYIKLTWNWTNSDYAIIKQSTDEGDTWDLVAKTMEPSYVLVPPITTTLTLAVRGVNIFAGWPVFTPNIDTTDYTLAVPPISGLRQYGDFDDTATIAWDAPRDRFSTMVTVYWNAAVQRQVVFDRTVTGYSYSASDAISDGNTSTITDGARDIRFSLVAVASNNALSATPAILDMSNEQVISLQNVRYEERLSDLVITYDMPDRRDFSGCEVHVSLDHGFTPSPATLLRRSNSNDITISGLLQPSTTYFVRVGGFDIWGLDSINYSSEARVDTSDSSTSGEIIWGDITGPGTPEWYATFTGLASSVVDPRFDRSATNGSLDPYWYASHPASIALSLSGGDDGGPAVIMTADNASHLKLYPGDGAGWPERLPASLGARFQLRAVLKKSTGMGAALEAAEMDKNNEVVHYGTAGNPDILPFDVYSKAEGVYTIQHADCRSVKIGIAIGPNAPVGETLGVDSFDIYQLPPGINEENIDDYIDENGIPTRQIKQGAVFVADVFEVEKDASPTSLTVPSVGVWSEWFVGQTYTVDFKGRKDGQALILSVFQQIDFPIQNTNSSTIADCQMQMDLVRTDDVVIWQFIDDVAWNNYFVMPTTGIVNYGASLLFTPWQSTGHSDAGQTDLYDPDPIDGLNSYQLRWRLKLGASGMTALDQQPGIGRLVAIGGKC